MNVCKIIIVSLLLSRKEYVLKERICKDDIVEVAKNIAKESQEVIQIATVAAGACTDSRMRTVGGANDMLDWVLQPIYMLVLHSHRAIAGKGCQYQFIFIK